MEGSVTTLSRYRLEKAREDLETAGMNLEGGKYRASINRSYYAVFHALREVTAMDCFDSGKHSGIIAYFNQNYVKTGIFDKSISRLIDSSYRLREKADYDDFFLVAREDAVSQIAKATQIIENIEEYLQQRYREEG